MIKNVWRSAALAAVAALYATAMAAGQSTSIDDLGVGKLLVASRGLGDPHFAESVVLLIHYGRQGTAGLMINRRTKLPVSSALKDMNTGKHASDPMYLGGPVELDVVIALLKAQKKPDDATSVLSDVYFVSSKPRLEKALAAIPDSDELRIYLGYCGWSTGQLENEVRLGGWWIFDASAGVVFDSNPDSMWSRFIAKTEEQIAQAAPPRAGSRCSYDEGPGSLNSDAAISIHSRSSGLRLEGFCARPYQ